MLHQVGELHRPQNGGNLVAIALDGEHPADRAPGGKDNLARLDFIYLRSIRIEGPRQPIGGEGTNRLVAMLHEDDVILVNNPCPTLGGHPPSPLSFGHLSELEGVADQDRPRNRREARPRLGIPQAAGLVAAALPASIGHQQEAAMTAVRSKTTLLACCCGCISPRLCGKIAGWSTELAFKSALTTKSFPWSHLCAVIN